MSFRDYYLKKYGSQQNRKEIDYSQGLEMGVEAYHRNMTPTELRQKSLAEATRLNQARLQTIVEGQDALLDGIRPLSSDNVRAMTPAQRLQSYISGSNKDPELAYDLENMSLDYLQGKYGNEVANFAVERSKQKLQNFSQASSYVPEREDDSFFGSGMNTEHLGLYVLMGIIAASLFGVLVQAGIKRGIIQHTPLPLKQRRKVLALLLFSIMMLIALPYIARTLQALFA